MILNGRVGQSLGMYILREGWAIFCDIKRGVGQSPNRESGAIPCDMKSEGAAIPFNIKRATPCDNISGWGSPLGGWRAHAEWSWRLALAQSPA